MKTEPQIKTEMQLPGDMTIQKLKARFDYSRQAYRRAFRKAHILDAADRGRFWEALNTKFPKYQILPYTNHVAYVKCNILASIYTVGKNATVIPTSDNDRDAVETINGFLDYYWNHQNVGMYQLQAGERAALTNLGITKVGYNADKKELEFLNIDPLKFMRDPSACDYEHAGYCMTWDSYHESVIRENALYKDEFEKYLKLREYKKNATNNYVDTYEHLDKFEPETKNQPGYYTIVVHYYKYDDNKIAEVHTINNEYVLYKKDEIKPAHFPFALLYCNLPARDLIGTSEPAKIFQNSVAINIMNSMYYTAEYKNQRPPRFINGQSGLNVPVFTKHSNDADKVFVVNGDASKAVHYHQFPTPSAAMPQMNNSLSNDISSVSGVDGHYTGRDTGSILTTGGIEGMLSQATLIDAPRIMLYEDYTKQLTNLVLGNLLEFGGKRTYLVKGQGGPGIKPGSQFFAKEINFPKYDKKAVYAFEIAISTVLPKNKQRQAEVATQIMEKQLQYQQAGQKVDWITPEEWLRYQDIPFREEMLERMGLQRYSNMVEDVTEAIVGFADLTQSGVDPQDAISMMAQNLVNKGQPDRQTYGEMMPENSEASLPADVLTNQMF